MAFQLPSGCKSIRRNGRYSIVFQNATVLAGTSPPSLESRESLPSIDFVVTLVKIVPGFLRLLFAHHFRQRGQEYSQNWPSSCHTLARSRITSWMNQRSYSASNFNPAASASLIIHTSGAWLRGHVSLWLFAILHQCPSGHPRTTLHSRLEHQSRPTIGEEHTSLARGVTLYRAGSWVDHE